MDNKEETMNIIGDTYTKWFDVLKKYGGKITTPTSEFESLRFSTPAEFGGAIARDFVTVSTKLSLKDLEKLNDPENLAKWIEVFVEPRDPLNPKIGKRPDTAEDDYETECLQVFLSESQDAMSQSIWAGVNKKSLTVPITSVVPLQPFANVIKMGNPEIIQDMSQVNAETSRRLENIFQKINSENFEVIPTLY